MGMPGMMICWYAGTLINCVLCADPHPGNVAVDAQSGSLIYYDFGMMGSIPGDVRSGLMELFYGVYEKDADRCLEALIIMGVLVPTGDKLAVRRTAQFFLKSFQVRWSCNNKNCMVVHSAGQHRQRSHTLRICVFTESQ